MKKIKPLIPVIIFMIIVFIGIVKINIINTKALSERTEESQGIDLQKLKDEFGEEFSSFIVDDSNIKIHEDNDNYIIEFNGDDYDATKVLGVANKIEESFEYLYSKIINLIE